MTVEARASFLNSSYGGQSRFGSDDLAVAAVKIATNDGADAVIEREISKRSVLRVTHLMLSLLLANSCDFDLFCHWSEYDAGWSIRKFNRKILLCQQVRCDVHLITDCTSVRNERVTF